MEGGPLHRLEKGGRLFKTNVQLTVKRAIYAAAVTRQATQGFSQLLRLDLLPSIEPLTRSLRRRFNKQIE
jgi:hypothetical protein